MAVPTELTLRVGQTATIPITGAGSVGYVWELTVEGDAVTASTGPASLDRDAYPKVGSLPQALTIEARAAGHALISMRLLRPRQKPREEHEIAVKVLP